MFSVDIIWAELKNEVVERQVLLDKRKPQWQDTKKFFLGFNPISKLYNIDDIEITIATLFIFHNSLWR